MTSIQRRIPPPSRRLLHTMAPNPRIVTSGKHVRKTLSGRSSDGTNEVAKASALNHVVDHGTVIVEESIRRPRAGNEGTRRVTNLCPHRESSRGFYKPRGNGAVPPIGCCRCGRFPSFHSAGSHVLARLWGQASRQRARSVRPQKRRHIAQEIVLVATSGDWGEQRATPHQLAVW